MALEMRKGAAGHLAKNPILAAEFLSEQEREAFNHERVVKPTAVLAQDTSTGASLTVKMPGYKGQPGSTEVSPRERTNAERKAAVEAEKERLQGLVDAAEESEEDDE